MFQRKERLEYYLLSCVNSFDKKRNSVRIFTNFSDLKYNQTGELTKNQNIMDLHLYTQNNVFFNVITYKDLNLVLNWNKRSTEILKSNLSGKNKNMEVYFNQQSKILKFQTIFVQSSVKTPLFEVQLINMGQDPFIHLQNMIKTLHKKNEDYIKNLEKDYKKTEEDIKKIELLDKQQTKKHEYQLSFAKQRFLTTINDVKKRARPHFGIFEQIKSEDEKTQTMTMPIYKIKGAQNNKEEKRPSINFLNLFS